MNKSTIQTELKPVKVETEVRVVQESVLGEVQTELQGIVVETEFGTGIRGQRGASPYEEWLQQGNTGTYDDFLSAIASLSSAASWDSNDW